MIVIQRKFIDEVEEAEADHSPIAASSRFRSASTLLSRCKGQLVTWIVRLTGYSIGATSISSSKWCFGKRNLSEKAVN
jgi:hypothetical protein